MIILLISRMKIRMTQIKSCQTIITHRHESLKL